MKKRVGKLSLTKETLRGLDPEALQAQGGGPPTTTIAQSMCNTYCVSGCGNTCVLCFTVACPPTTIGCA